MPKLYPNLNRQFMEKAREILRSEGYCALSMRRLSAACRTATGTVYNYYKSKDALIAAILMEDWRNVLAGMQEAAAAAPTLQDGLTAICRLISGFCQANNALWREFETAGGTDRAFAPHRLLLLEQVAGILKAMLTRLGENRLAAAAPLLAEAVLAAASQPDLGESMLLALLRLPCGTPVGMV